MCFLDLVMVPYGRANTLVAAIKGSAPEKEHLHIQTVWAGDWDEHNNKNIYLHTWVPTSSLYYVIQICIYSIKTGQHNGVAKQLQD